MYGGVRGKGCGAWCVVCGCVGVCDVVWMVW